MQAYSPILTELLDGWSAAERVLRGLRERAGARVVTAYPRLGAQLLAAMAIPGGWNKILLVCPEAHQLDLLVRQMRTLLDLGGLGGVAVCTLPELSPTPFDTLSAHTHLQLARAEAVSRLYGEGAAVIIVPATALRWGVVRPDVFRASSYAIRTGDSLDPKQLAERLVRLGYVRRELVGEAGEFAIRGFVIDVFSPDRGLPARIELFGDTVEALRSFNPATQRSSATLGEYTLIPLRSLPLSADAEEAIHAAITGRADLESERRGEMHQQLIDGEEAGWLWQQDSARRILVPIQQAAPEGTVMILAGGEPVRDALETQAVNWRNKALAEKRELSGFAGEMLAREEPFADKGTMAILDVLNLDLDADITGSDTDAINLGLRPVEEMQGSGDPFGRFLKLADSISGSGRRALVVLNSEGHVQRVADQLLERGARAKSIPDPAHPPADVLTALQEHPLGNILLVPGDLDRGVLIEELDLHLLSHRDIFGAPAARPRTSRASAFAVPIHELKAGDYIVHEDHGIGVFQGLRTISRGEEVLDFIQISYDGGDKLLLPVDRLDRIQRYSAIEGLRPRVDKLGGTSWNKVKTRVTRAIREMAGELLNLYALRRTVKGFSHLPDNEIVREFEHSFPFQETPDQVTAMAEIKADMEGDRPMDRLLCGDVGYGKTELAMRSAIKAAISGKQTAFLAPTTVLAHQHYETLSERLRGFPFAVDMISRFRTPQQQKEILQRLKEGKIHIIVGTHRLLSKDVVFRDLGLLVIDEEQRFGVSHKEKIKRMRTRVDVLALTATPIPRTLNMSIMGIRDMSVIQTPPRNRLAIQTKVLPFSRDVIAAAVSMELSRDGQVFYLRNRIEGLEEVASMIRTLVPHARPAIAHAQMSPQILERVMDGFIHGETNVLISTTIIENGLDIPRANTLIVERADLFGLAQLYQIRGRVGRSDRSAYAYLLVPPAKTMTEDARRRLQAIKEFSELGSGFRIAAMDLEIRGAGTLLGGEQSGHIEAVGFELYNRLLERTVAEMKGVSSERPFETSFKLNMDLHIPDDYINDTGTRMKYYRQASDARNEAELEELKEEMVDLYGPPPPSVQALLRYSRIRILASQLRIERMDREGATLVLKFTQESDINGRVLAELAAEEGNQFTSAGALHVRLRAADHLGALDEIVRLLHSLVRS